MIYYVNLPTINKTSRKLSQARSERQPLRMAWPWRSNAACPVWHSSRPASPTLVNHIARSPLRDTGTSCPPRKTVAGGCWSPPRTTARLRRQPRRLRSSQRERERRDGGAGPPPPAARAAARLALPSCAGCGCRSGVGSIPEGATIKEAAAGRGAASALQRQVSAPGGSVAVPGWCRLTPRGLHLLFCKDIRSRHLLPATVL